MIAIHIGCPKAGSTTIQKFLGDNTDALRRMGVDYPCIGRTSRGYHVNLFYDLRGHRNFKEKYGNISQLVENLKNHQYRLNVLSSEEFHQCKSKEIDNFKEKLLQIEEDIIIILIVRDLAESMPSTYSQATKSGDNVLDFDAFYRERVRRRGKTFLKTARAWGNAFGWDRLRVRLLDRKLLVNGDLIDDFLAAAGIDPNGRDFQRSETNGVANASPGWRVLEAVRGLYCEGHGLPARHPLSRSHEHNKNEKRLTCRVARQLGDEMGWNLDRGRYLSAAQARQCVKIHGKAIAALNKVLPQGLPQPLDLATRGFVEREFMPEAKQIPARELRRFYDELASRVSQKRPEATSA